MQYIIYDTERQVIIWDTSDSICFSILVKQKCSECLPVSVIVRYLNFFFKCWCNPRIIFRMKNSITSYAYLQDFSYAWNENARHFQRVGIWWKIWQGNMNLYCPDTWLSRPKWITRYIYTIILRYIKVNMHIKL